MKPNPSEVRHTLLFARKLIGKFAAYKREAIKDEKRQSKTGFYKCAIASVERQNTLTCVINAIKSQLK